MITDAEIEAVARKVCQELGIDPDQQTEIIAFHRMSRSERIAAVAPNGGFIPDDPKVVACWHYWRDDAEVAIAMKRALAVLDEGAPIAAFEAAIVARRKMRAAAAKAGL